MIYYANPTNAGPDGHAVRDAMSAGRLGCITTPEQGNVVFPGEWDVIADNGCFGGKWTHASWLRWLIDLPRTVRFAVAPDVFDITNPDAPQHEPTLERWRTYGPLIERHGFTPAFVCQIGCTIDNYPRDARVLFIGGNDAYKEGSDVWNITADAQPRGVWMHMGRVNTFRRLLVAARMGRGDGGHGMDSCDGTCLTYGADVNLPKMLRFVAAASAMAETQLGLFDNEEAHA